MTLLLTHNYSNDGWKGVDLLIAYVVVMELLLRFQPQTHPTHKAVAAGEFDETED